MDSSEGTSEYTHMHYKLWW